MYHNQKSPLAGKEVKIKQSAFEVGGHNIVVEDWWDRIAGKSWKNCDGNPAAMIYGMRAGLSTPALPIDDEVVYGKIGFSGHLVHLSELEDPTHG